MWHGRILPKSVDNKIHPWWRNSLVQKKLPNVPQEESSCSLANGLYSAPKAQYPKHKHPTSRKLLDHSHKFLVGTGGVQWGSALEAKAKIDLSTLKQSQSTQVPFHLLNGQITSIYACDCLMYVWGCNFCWAGLELTSLGLQKPKWNLGQTQAWTRGFRNGPGYWMNYFASFWRHLIFLSSLL